MLVLAGERASHGRGPAAKERHALIIGIRARHRDRV